MTFIDAALRVLSESEGPLNYRELTRRALELGLLNTTGKTPYGSMHARLSELERVAFGDGNIKQD